MEYRKKYVLRIHTPIELDKDKYRTCDISECAVNHFVFDTIEGVEEKVKELKNKFPLLISKKCLFLVEEVYDMSVPFDQW